MNNTAMLEGKKREEAERERIKYYQKHPEEWIVDRLRVPKETIDWELLPEYAKHKWDGTRNPFKKALSVLTQGKWLGIEGATGINKTYMAACICLWFLECFEDSMVVTIAPKEEQLGLHLWKEITRLHPRFGRGKLMSLELRMRPEATSEEGWKAVGFVAGVRAEEIGQSARKAQGFHGKDLLFILEETPGIAAPIITAIQNACISPNNIIIALGNPDHQLDELHKFCKLQRTEHIVISGFDHPNVVTKNPNFIPGAQSEQGLKDMLDRYKDREHPLFLSRARGISPKQAKEALIRYEWLIEAADRRKAFCDDNGYLQLDKIHGRKAIGADVANSESGDEGATAEGIGSILIEVEAKACPNANKFGSTLFYDMKVKGIAPECVAVDGVGVGAGCVNEMLRLGAKVIDIQSGSAPVDVPGKVEDFNNLRSQMWWQFRTDSEDPESDLALPMDEELFADLMAPKWETRNGKIIVESKEEIKKRLGRSPNKGDAVVYWNWVRKLRSIKAAQAGMTKKEEKRNEPGESLYNKTKFRYNPKTGKRKEYSF
jgi:hypothetical protein